WSARERAFYFVDIVGDTIWRWKPGRGREVFMRPSTKANGLTLDREGRLLVAGWASRSIWRVEPDGSVSTLASHYDGRKSRPARSSAHTVFRPIARSTALLAQKTSRCCL
ncbi:MAG: SMP-30/gluconolactonase/LRE family protein, partial [Burkholderiales bacterium]